MRLFLAGKCLRDVKDGNSKLAFLKLEEIFQTHQFHETVQINGKYHRKWAKNPIEHLFPSVDQRTRMVDCTTDLSSYESKDIANMVLHVNDHSVNAFMQQIRRRISILERPLVTQEEMEKVIFILIAIRNTLNMR